MEKPTFTAIDYNSLENKVIEERVRDYGNGNCNKG